MIGSGAMAGAGIATMAASRIGGLGGASVNSVIGGAMTGAGIGSAIPGIGTAIGAAVGGIGGIFSAITSGITEAKQRAEEFKQRMGEMANAMRAASATMRGLRLPGPLSEDAFHSLPGDVRAEVMTAFRTGGASAATAAMKRELERLRREGSTPHEPPGTRPGFDLSVPGVFDAVGMPLFTPPGRRAGIATGVATHEAAMSTLEKAITDGVEGITTPRVGRLPAGMNTDAMGAYDRIQEAIYSGGTEDPSTEFARRGADAAEATREEIRELRFLIEGRMAEMTPGP